MLVYIYEMSGYHGLANRYLVGQYTKMHRKINGQWSTVISSSRVLSTLNLVDPSCNILQRTMFLTSAAHEQVKSPCQKARPKAQQTCITALIDNREERGIGNAHLQCSSIMTSCRMLVTARLLIYNLYCTKIPAFVSVFNGSLTKAKHNA